MGYIWFVKNEIYQIGQYSLRLKLDSFEWTSYWVSITCLEIDRILWVLHHFITPTPQKRKNENPRKFVIVLKQFTIYATKKKYCALFQGTIIFGLDEDECHVKGTLYWNPHSPSNVSYTVEI